MSPSTAGRLAGIALRGCLPAVAQISASSFAGASTSGSVNDVLSPPKRLPSTRARSSYAAMDTERPSAATNPAVMRSAMRSGKNLTWPV